MSHCLFAIVVRSEDVKPEHIKHFVPSKKEDFLIISPAFAMKHSVPIDMRRVQLMTDYFGGHGQQEASYFDAHGRISHFPDNKEGGAINSALAMLGVEQENENDQFDVIGLGKYRSEEDLHPDHEQDHDDVERPLQRVSLSVDDYNEILGGLEDISNWVNIVDGAHEKIGHPKPNIGRKECEEMQTIAKKVLTLARKGVMVWATLS